MIWDELKDKIEVLRTLDNPVCICDTPKDDGECMFCSIMMCPHNEPLHFHHDGCPACWQEEQMKAKKRVLTSD